jgi:hypothetical protein
MLVVIAAGPSAGADDFADVKYTKGRARVLVVNSMWPYAPWADHLYACDEQWWDVHMPALRAAKFKGQLWTMSEEAAARHAGLRALGGVQGSDMVTAGGVLSWGGDAHTGGGNSGFQALHLAVSKLCEREIALLGFDMGATGAGHCHPDHVETENPQLRYFAGWVNAFNLAAVQLYNLGVQVTNCTRETALACFPRARIEEVL